MQTNTETGNRGPGGSGIDNILKWVWLINGFMFMVAVGIGGISFLAVAISRNSQQRQYNSAEYQRPAQSRALEADEETHLLMDLSTDYYHVRLADKNLSVLALTKQLQPRGTTSNDYESRKNSIHNLLFVDNNSLQTKTLFPHNKFTLQFEGVCEDKPGEAEGCTSKWLTLSVHKTDSNGDYLVDKEDDFTLAVVDAAGNHYTEITDNVRRGAIKKTADGTVLVRYERPQGRYVGSYSLKNMQWVKAPQKMEIDTLSW
jgi:hypothetical protein